MSIDERFPSLSLETVADSVAGDSIQADALCERARRHWREQAGFRRSFRGRDERAQLRVWMEHWTRGQKSAKRNSV